MIAHFREMTNTEPLSRQTHVHVDQHAMGEKRSRALDLAHIGEPIASNNKSPSLCQPTYTPAVDADVSFWDWGKI